MDEPPFANKRKPSQKWVCYFRVSTSKQGHSGLGLDAQRDSVTRYIAEKGGVIIAKFTEVESGKKASNRPALNEAIEMCRAKRAILCIAKLDRLARNVHFISGLLETGVSFLAVDQPTKDRFMLHLHAAFAEEEARRISIRTKEALAAAKRRGVMIGATGKVLAAKHKADALERARKYASIITELRASGIGTIRQLRDELNSRRIPSPGGARWHLLTTHKTVKRIDLLSTSSRSAAILN